MNSAGNETLDRIQKEIKESLEREKELKKEYTNLSNGYHNTINHGEDIVNGHGETKIEITNNVIPKKAELSDVKFRQNNVSSSTNNRIFIPNVKTKGVMDRFLKSRGKVSTSTIKTNSTKSWLNEPVFEPPKINPEKGIPTRNGFVPAEVKMRKELQEFQQREDELRKERRKSQPDIMAALEAEERANLSRPSFTNGFSLSRHLSLANLCDTTEDELGTPGTLSLIQQFENLKHF